MRVCVFGAVPEPGRADAYARIAGSCDAVVGADAGALACLDIGIVPALAVGDFDSCGADGLSRLAAAGVPTEVHPAEKDASDLDLAVQAARRMGAGEVVVTAAFTGRPDHTLAAFGTLLAAVDPPAVAVEPDWSAHVVGPGHRPLLCLDLAAGTLVSLLSPGGAAGVAVSGVAYPLAEAELAPLASLGVSNAALGGPVTVSCGEGDLLVFVLGVA